MTMGCWKRSPPADKEDNNTYSVVINQAKRARGAGVDKEAGISVPMTGCEVYLHPLASHDGLLVQLVPPRQPVDEHLDHVPCDIVLVIDVSYSMNALAPAPPNNKGETAEETGMTVLDLTKHAANTIIETLDHRDRLAIVLLPLVSMKPEDKATARREIESMQVEACTNLWGGMKRGLEQFAINDEYAGNVQAMFLLTDGKPFGGEATPSDGWVSGMRRLGILPANIHTFGFGYALDPCLLQSIAELGQGHYSFIPDSSMLGTVFIHAVANLQSTFARQAVLTLTYPSVLGLEEIGTHINQEKPTSVDRGTKMASLQYAINLSTIQYGQSREIYLRYSCRPEVLTQVMADGYPSLHVQAKLEYRHGKDLYWETAGSDIRDDVARLSPSEMAYHLSRAAVVDFISKLFPLDRVGEHKPLKEDRIPKYDDLQAFLKDLPGNRMEHRGDPRNCALIQDLSGDDTEDGQVELALRTDSNLNHWDKWGRHYLASLAGAHARQTRMSFKDPGTQLYGANSPLFLARLAVLSGAFDNLVPPKPSGHMRSKKSQTSYSSGDAPPSYTPDPVSMARYNNKESSCFAGETRVLLAPLPRGSADEEKERDKKSEETTIAMKQLRSGMAVLTLQGPRTVRSVLECHTDQTAGRTMCALPVGKAASLWVTPWHPVSLDEGRTWSFPADTHPSMLRAGFKEPVYAVQLRRETDDHVDAHTIHVDGAWAVTLGHGLVEPGPAAQERDVRNHVFYGDYDAVAAGLDALPPGPHGLALGDGTTRDAATGLSAGWLPFHVVESCFTGTPCANANTVIRTPSRRFKGHERLKITCP